MNPMGGSEILYLNFIKYLSSYISPRLNLILSNCNADLLDPNRVNVIWQHLNSNEEIVFGMNNKELVERVDAFIFVSHWQYNRFKQVYQTPAFKSFVIKNAIEPIGFLEKPKTNKLKLIYTSTPWRGLDVLLDAFELLNRDDIELEVFSSSKIYGNNFENITQGMFDELFQRARTTKNVTFYEYAPNDIVRKHLQQAHIFAYPSVFEETSCLAAIEAAAAGCKIVTTNLGALPETLNDWATYVPLGFDRQILVQSFARALNQAINEYWNKETQEHIRAQSQHYNHFWSWNFRKVEWQQFLELIK